MSKGVQKNCWLAAGDLRALSHPGSICRRRCSLMLAAVDCGSKLRPGSLKGGELPVWLATLESPCLPSILGLPAWRALLLMVDMYPQGGGPVFPGVTVVGI